MPEFGLFLYLKRRKFAWAQNPIWRSAKCEQRQYLLQTKFSYIIIFGWLSYGAFWWPPKRAGLTSLRDYQLSVCRDTEQTLLIPILEKRADKFPRLHLPLEPSWTVHTRFRAAKKLPNFQRDKRSTFQYERHKTYHRLSSVAQPLSWQTTDSRCSLRKHRCLPSPGQSLRGRRASHWIVSTNNNNKYSQLVFWTFTFLTLNFMPASSQRKKPSAPMRTQVQAVASSLSS